MAEQKARILVIKLGALGDLILAREAFYAIRCHHPDAEMTLLTRRQFVQLGEMMPWFDRVVADPQCTWGQMRSLWQWRRELKTLRPNCVYDLQGNDRTGLYFWLMQPGAPKWCGPVWGASQRTRDHRRDPVPAAERHLRMLESVGVARAGMPEDAWLSGSIEHFNLPSRYAVLVAGCAPSRPAKRWPVESFAALVQLLAREHGLASVAIGTAADALAVGEICQLAPEVINLCGQTDLGQLAQIFRHSRMVIGNDTGPIHIAAMVGAPVLVLMGPETDPVRMLPRGNRVTYLHRQTLAEITPAEVLTKINRE